MGAVVGSGRAGEGGLQPPECTAARLAQLPPPTVAGGREGRAGAAVRERIIENVTAYKNILTLIEQEYGAFIARIKNGQRNAFFLHGRLKALESESTALLYYRKRAMELEDKIKAIQKNSAKIKNVILEIYNVRKVPSETFGTSGKTAHPLKPIPGLSVEESLSLDSLSKHLAQLDRRVLELKKERGKKIVMWLSYAAMFYISALDVPSKMAEDSLEYFESFNELLSRGQYDAAATYAVSPRGILCNEKALKYLKSVSCLKGRNLSLLKYFDTLLNSSTAAGHLPNSAITLEAIKCALSEKQLNLVTHWVKQQRLTFSEVGDIIYHYGKVEPSNESKCLALARVAYGQSGAHKKVALYLCKWGRISGAMDYVQQLEHFSMITSFCWKAVLALHEFAISVNSGLENPISIYEGYNPVFCLSDHKRHGFELLEEMSKKNALEQVILNDTVCTLEDWNKIAVVCAENKHEKLSQEIVSILTSQDGVFENSPLEDEKDARIKNGTRFLVVFLYNNRGSSYSSQAKKPSSSLYEP
ncbi:LOW QUALITY PROTEIN: clathrin heavy chain linker domain-containing protein 1 [Spheniscus humboldti]